MIPCGLCHRNGVDSIFSFFCFVFLSHSLQTHRAFLVKCVCVRACVRACVRGCVCEG